MRRPTDPSAVVRDLGDDAARRALVHKWGDAEPGALPAWVAEMDYALAPVVATALLDAVRAGRTGYPSVRPGGPLGEAYAGFAARRFGHAVDPGLVVPVSDVTAGMRLVLDVLSDPGPVAVPTPAYPPHLELPAVTGRRLVEVPTDPDGPGRLDLDRLGRAFAAGARTLLLTQPHNPLGSVPTRAELEALRDLAVHHGVRVVSDEIHAPLVLPGARHVPYLSLPGTADHAVALVSASKAFNVAGLRCAQIVTGDAATAARLRAVPGVRNDSWSPLGVVAAVAAYTDGDPWLDALVARLDAQHSLLARLLEEHLPAARMRPPEATYLAWLDLRAYDPDPAARALERAHVQLSPGHDFQPGLPGHARLNVATSPERLRAAVERVAQALR